MSKVYLKHTLKEGDHKVMNKGEPPHAGWWLTAVRPGEKGYTGRKGWRWWNGRYWSSPVMADKAANEGSGAEAKRLVTYASIWDNDDVSWCYAWPKNARVGRVNPDTGEVTGAGPDPYKVQAAAPKPVRRSRWTKVA